MEEKRNAYSVLVGKPEGKKLLETPRGGRIILKLILEKKEGMCTGFIWLRIRTSGEKL
jgi:hypothetical protein